MTDYTLHNKPPAGFGFIYKITSPDGKSYIGQTIQTVAHRVGQHKTGHCSMLLDAIKTFGIENMSVSILKCCPKDELCTEEKFYIKQFFSLCPSGLNLESGGIYAKHHKDTKARISKARTGMKFTPEHIENMKEAQKITQSTPEYRNKQSDDLKAQWADPEIKAKMCAGRKGRKHTAETKAKISAASKARKFSKESCAKRSAKALARWADPVWRAKTIEAMKSAKRGINK